MCGIAGFCQFDGDFTCERERWTRVLIKMREALAHRGEDQTGEYLEKAAALSHTRLSIRDLTNGAQPMVRTAENQDYVIVYNGEVYNTGELTPELMRRGYRFETTCDTEVILYAYMEYGLNFAEKLNGIFAVSIWDARENRLVLCRDRMGVKPLFYSLLQNTLVFASEPKALFCHPQIVPQADLDSFREIFGIGPARTPGCGVFKGVREVKPGYLVVFSKNGLQEHRYWSLEARPHTDSYPETVEKVSFLLWDAVERQEAVLADSGYTFLLVSPYLEMADDGDIDRVNELYDYCQAYGYSFYCLTASGDEMISRWQDFAGAEYPFALTDDITLKTMVRSNPGLVLLKGGTVYGKWGCHSFPKVEDLNVPLEENEWGTLRSDSRMMTTLRVVLWFLVPLFVFSLVDRLWIGGKMYKRKKHRDSITNLLNKRKMRKKIVAGNWKMNLNLQEGVALATELKNALAADQPNCEVVICTPFIHLASVAQVLEGSVIGLGAENCADKEKGAYTGEVSAAMVKSTGAQYVILGHSERRAYYGETAEILKEKVNLALANGLKVIFCIGEVLEEREADKQNEVVKAQLAGSLFDLTAEQFSNIVLAYEPVWAIGTGKTATAEQAEEMHAFIRATIAGKFGAEAAENVSILYGGSCKPTNAKEIFAKPDVDGGLIGGAALKCADFKGIIDAWKA